ncbi:MAG: hypothetical protein R3C01_00865 [Planctomycetaceae bacterium]
MYEVCERLRVWYTFGIGMNSRLKRRAKTFLETAVTEYGRTDQKQRLFTALTDQAQTWIVLDQLDQGGCHAVGTNRRASRRTVPER